MIYCVIPRELEADLYDKMVDYYEGNPDVTVIVERRDGPDRREGEDIAEETKAAADIAIRGLLKDAVSTATLLLERHRAALELVAVELREHETLEGLALVAVLERATQELAGTKAKARRTPARAGR